MNSQVAPECALCSPIEDDSPVLRRAPDLALDSDHELPVNGDDLVASQVSHLLGVEQQDQVLECFVAAGASLLLPHGEISCR